ncbi:MAG TPA: phosphoribosyltransferase family protein, partial [candidate division Zixibacteria bacterium]|nr:phosphoribosyltransferase family protein [candidate division Zixibacteria bacterium]
MLLAQDRIARRINELGQAITRDYAGRTPVFLGVLKGCVVFMADLMRAVKLPLEVEFISAESYHDGTAQQELKLDHWFTRSLRGRDVLIVEGVGGFCVPLGVDR